MIKYAGQDTGKDQQEGGVEKGDKTKKKKREANSDDGEGRGEA